MNIRVDLNTPIKDGTEVVFRSPVDCSQITGLILYYNGESKEFAFADAHGNNVGDIDHLFAENVVVKVILDVTTGMAFVQNADTNAYLENKFKETIDKCCPPFTESGSIVTCEPVEGYPLEITAEDGATNITRTGKNVFGGDALADALESKDNGKGVTKNKADKTVTFEPGLITRTGHLFNKFKEKTQYTIILYGYAVTAEGAVNIRVQYTDETAESLYFGTSAKPNPANEPGYCIHKTNPNKTVWRITPQWVGTKTVLYYDQCGVFEGNVSAAEFEAYRAETFPVGEQISALPGVNTLWANSGDITVTGKADPVKFMEGLPSGGGSSNAVLYTKQTLTEAQKEQARANIGAVDNAYVDKAVADATSGVDLSEYELKGSTPQYLAGADTRYNIVLDIKEETAVSIVSDTVAELAGAANVTFQGCTETHEGGIYTLECQSTAVWHQVKKTFTFHGLVPGESYKLVYDVTGVVQSDTIQSGYYSNLMITDANGETLVSKPIHTDEGNIRRFAFTPKSESVTVSLYTTSSAHPNQVGNKIRYRDIWINKADATEVRTDVYKLSTTTSERLQLSDIGGGVTITANPAANVYAQVIEGDIPDGPLAGKTCVCFGDSITGNYVAPFDYPSIIAQKTGMNVINGGFGGCRMSQHPSSEYTAFSMYNLADSIATGDWSVQDAAIGTVGSANATEHLASLKEVDWSAVDFITIFYGTNDFMGGVAIGADDGSQSTSQFKGALRHSIETILTAYPKIRIVLITPIYRFWENGGVVTDSDTYEVSGAKLTDFVDAVISVADEYKVPAFNLYNSLGINKINRMTFLADGVHPSETGRERIGESISARLSAI